MPERARRVAPAATLVVAAAVALGVGLAATAQPWGLPAVTLVAVLAAAVASGALGAALWTSRPGQAAFERALTTASVAAAVLTVAATAGLAVAFAAQTDVADIGTFLAQTRAGRAWTVAAATAAVLTIAGFLARGWAATLAVAALSVPALAATAVAASARGGWMPVTAVVALAGLAVGVGAFLVAPRAGTDPRGRRARIDPWALGVLGALAGLVVALPPSPSPSLADATPAEILTGRPMPPAPGALTELTSVLPEPVWVLAVGFGLLCYLTWVGRVSRPRRPRGVRGDGGGWPVSRTFAWCAGLALLAWVTCGAPAVYGPVLFSVDAAARALLTLAVPLLLVAGAPGALASRAVALRTDGTRGLREWAAVASATPLARLLSRPLVAAVALSLVQWAFPYSELLRASLGSEAARIATQALVIAVGCLFARSLLARGAAARGRFVERVVALAVVLGSCLAWATAVGGAPGLFAAEWFGSLPREWGPTPREDQAAGAGAALLVVVPLLVLAVVVVARRPPAAATAATAAEGAAPPAPRRRQAPQARRGIDELAAYDARLSGIPARPEPGPPELGPPEPGPPDAESEASTPR